MLSIRPVLTILLVIMLVGAEEIAFSQGFPTKPIRIITAEVGGGSDFAARIIGQGISGPLGQPVIVENRTSYLGADIGAKAPADGYTLLHAGNSLWLLPRMKDDVPSERNFTPITITQVAPQVLVVTPSLPIKSVKELITLAKSKPSALNYSSSTSGSASHLAAELFNAMAGIQIVRIAYKGNGPAGLAAASGEVQVSFPSSGTSSPLIKSGKLRALAVTSAKPSALLPDLPTVAASGLPGYEMVNLTGIFAPAKTPGAVVRKLNQEIVRVLNNADVKDKFLGIGVEPVAGTPEQFAEAVKLDIGRLGKVIKDSGIKAE